MQLTLTSAVGLLAAIAPAFASSPVTSDLKTLAENDGKVREAFDAISIINFVSQAPVSSILFSEDRNQVLTTTKKAFQLYRDELIVPKTKDIHGFPGSVEAADQASVCESYVKVILLLLLLCQYRTVQLERISINSFS